ncbi:hypothetical protein X943_004054 [Babesia divergens]|uniref:Uncharacterized protein n=1 Tax=Babesia divergens TaxID=32595 RepID=A0AAD9GIL2_BABDI|nr:hypothetical protein X943_004054 [Babesia divergens]
MKMIPNSLASATHLTNVYLFIISLFCFSYYLVGQNLVDLYNQTKCVLLASIVSCVFSVGVLGFARSYVAFVDCLIWIMIVRGLQASMPAMEMSDRSKEEEKEQQAHHCFVNTMPIRIYFGAMLQATFRWCGIPGTTNL